jgi:hypothetical protein
MPTRPCHRKPGVFLAPRRRSLPPAERSNWRVVAAVSPPPPSSLQQPVLPLSLLVDPAWAKIAHGGFRVGVTPGVLSADMETLILKLSAGREEQFDAIACLAHNAWRPAGGRVLTPAFVAYRSEAITVITAVHTWAVTCVGATNPAMPDPRDMMHRASGLAASSLQDGMVPCASVIGSSFHVWGRAVAILDKFLAGDVCQLDSPVFTDDHRHRLILCASACYVIAWKTHFATFGLLLDQVYQCILEYYTSTDSLRGGEKFKYVKVLRDGDWIKANPGPTRDFRTRLNTEPFYTKTMQGLSLESAELCVLRECGWGLEMSTIPDAIDAMLGTKVDADFKMAQVRILAYFYGMRLILDAETMHSDRALALYSAYAALCEAALVVKVPIMHVLRLAD